jgi:diguanylate cyclase (GGDEF)-like protein
VTGPGRVWILTSVVVVVALALSWTVRDLPSLEAPFNIAWPMLIPLVYLAEVTVVHLHFRRDAHSFSMSEIPLIVGLFFTSPIGLIGAQLVGNALALSLNRRQSPTKLVFNLSQFTLQSVLAVIVFRWILGGGDPQGAAGWIGILVALGLAVLVANILINVAIHLAGGNLERSEQLDVLKLGAAATLMNSSLGLVAITVMWTRAPAVWAAAVPPVVLYLAYRAYIAQEEEHRRLQALYEATRALHASTQVEAAMLVAATHARSMFEAERAEILIFPGGLDRDGYRTGVGPGEHEETMQKISGNTVDETWVETLGSGRSRLLHRESGRRRTLRRHAYDEMVVPIQRPEGTNGVMVVVDPLGDVRTFTSRDLRFLETLSSQVSVSLEKGRLEASVVQLTHLEKDLRHRATHDTLTGLANRALLRERLGEVADEAETGSTPAAILFLDLDDFKTVNDTFGHPAGDQLLVAVAQRLQSCCRPHDTVARLGGDEFAVLLEHLSTPEDAITVTERIIGVLRQPFMVLGRQVISHASVGVALVQPGFGPDELMRHADLAMYSAKRRGKGSYQVFEDGLQDRSA